jgi:DNA-binding NtrC family response regulator
MANILLIDDEPVLLDLISASLQKEGHNVIAISEPLTALGLFKSGEPAFDLIVTDVEMRPINGFEVVKRLIHGGWHGPVLFMTGHSSRPGANTSSQGKGAIIEKPFTAIEFRSAVARALIRGKSESTTVA